MQDSLDEAIKNSTMLPKMTVMPSYDDVKDECRGVCAS